MASYRSDEISFRKINGVGVIEIIIPKFSQLKIYHASSGIDFMRETEDGRLNGESLPVGTEIDKVCLRVTASAYLPKKEEEH